MAYTRMGHTTWDYKELKVFPSKKVKLNDYVKVDRLNRIIIYKIININRKNKQEVFHLERFSYKTKEEIG